MNTPDDASTATSVSVRAAAVTGAWLGASGMALGAFGAHALRARIAPEMLEIYRTGVLYHLFHAVALLAVAALGSRLSRPRLTVALFAAGVLVFSGSLYTLAITGVRTWGAVTPVGGVALIAGWLSIAFGLGRPSASSLRRP
ncbi:MAG: DUF423 domain-containing protein [Bacteroidota bacterium]